ENALAEPDRTFTVNLSGASGAILGSVPTVTVSVRDNEPDTWPVGGCAVPAGYANSAGNVVNWATASDSTWQGTCSLESGAFTAAATGNSGIEYTGVMGAGNITFKYRVSSHGSNPANGRMEFLVDGAIVLTDSGGNGWESYSTAVTAGT